MAFDFFTEKRKNDLFCCLLRLPMPPIREKKRKFYAKVQAARATPVLKSSGCILSIEWHCSRFSVRETGAVHKSNPPTHPVPKAMAFVLGTPPPLFLLISLLFF
jgi:hypothetical protein